MTLILNMVGIYFGVIAAACFSTGNPVLLPVVMSVLFLANTPISKAITEPLPWHMTFMGINLAMMFYAASFRTPYMTAAAVSFMAVALLLMLIMLRVQWADRLYTQIGMVLIFVTVFSASAHIAVDALT